LDQGQQSDDNQQQHGGSSQDGHACSVTRIDRSRKTIRGVVMWCGVVWCGVVWGSRKWRGESGE
jgi:hypothetical protein